MFSSSAQKHGKSEGENRGSKKKTDWKRREERKTVWWAKKQATHPPMSVTLKGKTDEDWQKEVRNEKTTSDRGRDQSGEGGRRTNFHVSENKLREKGKGEKSEATWNRNGETTNLLSHLWIAPLYSAKGGATTRTEQTKQEEKRSGAGKKKEGNNKRRVENSDKRSKYLIKKQNDFLFPCNTACMKAVKVAQKKEKKRNPAYPEDHGQSEPDHVYFLNSWKKETLLWTEDFMWKQPFVISVQDVRLLLAVISFVVWKKAIKPPITGTTDLPEPTLVVWLTVMLVPSVAVKWCPGSNGVRPLKLTEAIPRKSPFLSWTVWKIPPSSCRGRPAVPWALKSKSVNFKGYLTSLKYNNYTAIETLVKLPKKHGGLNEKHPAGFLFLFHPLWCLSACYQVGF